MAKPATRIGAIQALLAFGAIAVIGRSFMVQVIEGKQWQEKAKVSRTSSEIVEARRGTIFDRNGVPLAVTQERYRLQITPHEMKEPEKVMRLLARVGFARARIDKEFARKYGNFQELLTAEQIAPFWELSGVHPEPEYRRVYPLQRLASKWLGVIGDAGRPMGGIESALDTVLTGVPGRAEYLKDGGGRLMELPGSRVLEPVPGHDVYLTIDHDLQGIVEAELLESVRGLPARGGDIIILDVHSGEILAIASLRTDSIGRLIPTTSAIVEAAEPGSTAKIFAAAAVLRNGADTTPVPGHNGDWVVPGTVRHHIDVHKEAGLLTLGETIKVSSNVAISQFALRLTEEQQFKTLRDFGFGTPPSLGFPAEEEGMLHNPPYVNHLLSQPSLAQGYEFNATSLQVATGYAAIANGGALMAASLIRSVRAEADTAPLWRHEPQTIRRPISSAVASQLRDYLRLATGEGGSGAKAQLDFFSVIGKTATAKLAEFNYNPGIYRAAFAGLFPGDDPQVVVYVMIDRPTGAFYGGDIAAPIVRRILLQALATQTSPLDRHRLEAQVAARPTAPPRKPGPDSVRSVAFPMKSSHIVDTGAVMVPEVTGFGSRAAIAAMHRSGLRVRLSGSGSVASTLPAIGVAVPRGTTITIRLTTMP